MKAGSTALLLLLIFIACSNGGPHHERVPPFHLDRRPSISACGGTGPARINSTTQPSPADAVFCNALHPVAYRTDAYPAFVAKVCAFVTNRTAIVNNDALALSRRVAPDVRDGPNFAAYTLLMWAHQYIPTVPRGLWLEFGVADGHSANLTSMHLEGVTSSAGVNVVGFDSFQGLPRTWYRYPEQKQWGAIQQGAFSRNGVPPPVRPRVHLIKGLFETTLEPYLTAHPGLPLAFVNVDNDLYEGARYVLRRLHHRLAVGSLLHLHDALLHDYFGCRPQVHPHRALISLSTMYDTCLCTRRVARRSCGRCTTRWWRSRPCACSWCRSPRSSKSPCCSASSPRRE